MKQIKKKFIKYKKWAEEHLFSVWVISSCLFAFIIHCLFSATAPNEWFVAKWGAGDILTFVSTSALSLLAVWQNRKFKEENDIAQTRMENLAKKANELPIISKIIDYESEKLSRLRNKAQNYIDVCATESASDDLSAFAMKPEQFSNLYVKIKTDKRMQQIRQCGVELLYELEIYPEIAEVDKLINLIAEYSHLSIELVEKIRAGSSEDGLKDLYENTEKAEREFIKSIWGFISIKEKQLSEVVYGDLTFDQIKEIYGYKG